MTANNDNMGLTSEGGAKWELFTLENGVTLRTKDGFGKYINFADITIMLIRYFVDKVDDCAAFVLDRVYHDCNILSINVVFTDDNKWVV